MTAMLVTANPATALDDDYTDYGVLLQKHVRWIANGNASAVDYAGLQREQPALNAVLAQLSAVGLVEFSAWNREQQMAFLINAYNAFTLALILTRYPDLQSIRELGSLLRSPWKKSFFTLLGDTRNLDWIEHERLRPEYGDARVHFAINCASVGCPALRPEPFVAARLGEQLDDQQRRFLSDRSRNRFNAADGTLRVSEIFTWFAADFAGNFANNFANKHGTLKDWLAARAELLGDSDADRARIQRGDFRIQHPSYDWTLNALDRKR